jgi:hypothetical protein
MPARAGSTIFCRRDDDPLVVLSTACLPCIIPPPPLVVLSASRLPCPAPSTPPSHHVAHPLPTMRQHCHRLITVSSFFPRPRSSNRPLPALPATSARTAPTSLLPQPPPCQQMKAPILVEKASPDLLPPGTLAPHRSRTDQVARGRPPAGDESIGHSVMWLMVPGVVSNDGKGLI